MFILHGIYDFDVLKSLSKGNTSIHACWTKSMFSVQYSMISEYFRFTYSISDIYLDFRPQKSTLVVILQESTHSLFLSKQEIKLIKKSTFH